MGAKRTPTLAGPARTCHPAARGAAERLITAVVVEAHDEWQAAERRYLSETSMAQLRRDEKAAIAEAPDRALESRPLAG